ncbi:hypothetical protein A5819_000789 [Enterococcus sp. 7E2_DIV0204]|nr:hypothetical protein A5819_000789 [Enterococcus sp. 7E2_DIV0204]OTP48160.1 hypothetical protein A5884_003220 [Enterococcus sp. 7D2_DIV0200]
MLNDPHFFYSQYNKKNKMSEFSKISLTYLVDKAIIDKITYKTNKGVTLTNAYQALIASRNDDFL